MKLKKHEFSLFRTSVSLAFGLVCLVALAVFNQAISAYATKEGWDQIFISGWRMITNLGWGSLVAFAFFALGGATVALWLEFWFRNWRQTRDEQDNMALSCNASFSFTKSSNGELGMSLNDLSENVGYYAWYVNNGGTMQNEAMFIFVEFEKEIPLPEVFANSATANGEWRQFASTDRFMFVEIKGWPENDVWFQVFDSKALGLDRRSELKVWRKFAPIGVPGTQGVPGRVPGTRRVPGTQY